LARAAFLDRQGDPQGRTGREARGGQTGGRPQRRREPQHAPARHREREIDVEERSRDQMAAEANTFAGAAAAAQSLLTAAKWEGVRKDRNDLFGRMMGLHDEMAERLAQIHSAFGSSSEATTAAVRVNEELEACLRHLYGVYNALSRGEEVDEEWELLEAEERELSASRTYFGEAARAELLVNGGGRARI